MPRTYLIFGDIEGKLGVLRVGTPGDFAREITITVMAFHIPTESQ